MADLLFTDGCDHYDTAALLKKWSAKSATFYILDTAPAGRSTTTAIRTSTSHWGNKIFPNQVTVAVGIAYYCDGRPGSDTSVVGFLDGSTVQCDVRLTASGELRVTRNGTSLQVTSGLNFAINQWHAIGFKVTVGNSGSWSVTLDGVEVLAGTGDTQATVNEQTNVLQIWGVSGNVYLKDIYLFGGADAAYLGDRRVGYIVPSGAGAYANFTPSAGANWQNVDEIPPDGDTSYNASSTAGHKDSFAHAALSNVGAINGLMVWSYARKDDAGVRTLREFLRIGGTDYNGTSRNIGDAYLYYGSPFVVNPATSNPFTPAEVAALEPGYELVA